jgi:hypothetical protein
MNNECGAVGEMIIGRGTELLSKNLHQCVFIKSSSVKELFRGSFSKDE